MRHDQIFRTYAIKRKIIVLFYQYRINRFLKKALQGDEHCSTKIEIEDIADVLGELESSYNESYQEDFNEIISSKLAGICPKCSKKWNGRDLLEISKYEEFKEADIFIRRPAEALRLIRGVCGNCSCESKYIILTWDLSNGKLSRKRSQVPWRFTLLLAIIFYIFAAIMVVALSSIKITAAYIINTFDEKELSKIFFELGEEPKGQKLCGMLSP